MVSQVMSATRGATDAFSGVSRHVNTAVSKLYQAFLIFIIVHLGIFLCLIVSFIVL